MKVLLLGNYPPDRQESMQRFAKMLLSELPAHGVTVELIRPRPFFNAGQQSRGLGKYLGYLDKFLIFPLQLKKQLRARPDCVVHICDHSNAVYTKYLRRIPHLVTCHDLLAVRLALGEIPQNPTGWAGRRLQKMILDGLNRARAVACVSQATKTDVLRLSRLKPEQVKVVYNGLNYSYAPVPPAESTALLERFHLPGPFLLHVGDEHWYKNRRGAVEIYAQLRRLLPAAPALVLVGKKPSAQLAQFIAEQNLTAHVIAIAGSSNEELRALYSRAELLLFPSLMEGFGWPIVEAQACGCRVVTTNRPPMNEIGGEATVYIDPQEIARAAETVRDVITEETVARREREQQSQAHAAGFSAEKMVEDYVRLYRKL